MSSRFGFEVKVLDGSDGISDHQREAFIEYGTRAISPINPVVANALRIQRASISKRFLTTKIECKTDQKFFIRILPEGGWPDMEYLTDYRNPPYVFSVEVYIDGNRKAELDVMLTELDPKRYATMPALLLKGRTILIGTDNTGSSRLQSQGWKFTELGIELQMDHLSIHADGGTRQNPRNRDPHDNQVGQIVVKIYRRITTGTGRVVTRRIIGSAHIPEPTTFGRHVTHQARLDDGFHQERAANGVMTKPYRPGEGAFATFVFQYMDRKKLVSLGLCDLDGKHTPDVARARVLRSSGTVAGSKRSGSECITKETFGMDLAFRPKPHGP